MGGSCGQLPVPSVGDLSNGGGRREAADGHIAAGDLHTPTSNLEQTTTFKKKVDFFSVFLSPPGPRTGPGPPVAPRPACSAHAEARALICLLYTSPSPRDRG